MTYEVFFHRLKKVLTKQNFGKNKTNKNVCSYEELNSKCCIDDVSCGLNTHRLEGRLRITFILCTNIGSVHVFVPHYDLATNKRTVFSHSLSLSVARTRRDERATESEKKNTKKQKQMLIQRMFRFLCTLSQQGYLCQRERETSLLFLYFLFVSSRLRTTSSVYRSRLLWVVNNRTKRMSDRILRTKHLCAQQNTMTAFILQWGL